jgi:hypothetical protein
MQRHFHPFSMRPIDLQVDLLVIAETLVRALIF